MSLNSLWYSICIKNINERHEGEIISHDINVRHILKQKRDNRSSLNDFLLLECISFNSVKVGSSYEHCIHTYHFDTRRLFALPMCKTILYDEIFIRSIFANVLR